MSKPCGEQENMFIRENTHFITSDLTPDPRSHLDVLFTWLSMQRLGLTKAIISELETHGALFHKNILKKILHLQHYYSLFDHTQYGLEGGEGRQTYHPS